MGEKGKHPNSLANLKKWSKGDIPNPRGAGAHNPYVKGLKKITSEEYADIIDFALQHDITSLRKLAKDPLTSAIKMGVAKALIKAIDDSNWGILNAIVERLVGKPVQQIQLNANVKNEVDLSQFSDEDLLKLKDILAKNLPVDTTATTINTDPV